MFQRDLLALWVEEILNPPSDGSSDSSSDDQKQQVAQQVVSTPQFQQWAATQAPGFAQMPAPQQAQVIQSYVADSVSQIAAAPGDSQGDLGAAAQAFSQSLPQASAPSPGPAVSAPVTMASTSAPAPSSGGGSVGTIPATTAARGAGIKTSV